MSSPYSLTPIPSAAAIRAACELDPIHAKAYLDPQSYQDQFVHPSTWPDECRAEIYRAARVIDSHFSQSPAWQPIETAPKDGTVVLTDEGTAFHVERGGFSFWKASTVYGLSYCHRDGSPAILSPRLWMPFPQLPKRD